MKRRRRTAVIICIVILAANILGLIHLNNSPNKNLISAKDGVLSLAGWDFYKQETVKIGGTWEFYPGKLIIPKQDEDIFKEYTRLRKFVEVPKDWRNYAGYSLHSYDSGTFRLRLEVPEDGSYGIRSEDIKCGLAVYINGTKVCGNGQSTDQAKEFTTDRKGLLGIGGSSGNELELVIQIEGYSGEIGGILHYIEFGTADGILKHRDADRAMEVFVVSCCMVVGFCLAGSSLWKKGSRSLLYFGFFLILQGIYISTIGEKLIRDIFPLPKDILLFFEFQIYVMYLSFFCILLLINYLFKEYAIKKVVVFLGIILLLVGPYFNWVPYGSVLNMGISLYQHKVIIVVIIAGTLFYIISILCRAFLKGVDYAGYIIVLSTVFFCYLSALGLSFLFDISVGKVPTIMMLAMILMQITFMYYRSRLAFRKVDQLSSQLLAYDHMKDKFLAKTSLELQKPTNSIIDLSETLLKGEKGPLSFYQQQNIMQVNREGKNVFSILEEMLEASGENQDIKIQIEDIDGEMLKSIITDLEYLVYDRKNLKILKNIPGDFPGIKSDKRKLRQIMYHLMHNAVKFTEAGEIAISAEVHGNEAFISVRDTGTGIPKSQREIIFIPFYQGKKQGTGEAEGFGLGLGITKNLVELMGGRIWLVSEQGKGSRFTFSMPLAKTKGKEELKVPLLLEKPEYTGLREEKEPEYVRFDGSKNETILIALREERLLRELLRLNQEEKYTLIVFDSYDKVPEFVREEKIDLIILDLSMDNVKGYETCQRIREHYTMAELPVIILTEGWQAKELQKSVQTGINDFMKIPFSWEELKVRIETLLLVKNSAKEAINQEHKKLHAQIMPHFLYNTLNTIIGLSYKDAEQACEALQHLSTYFRAKLDFNSYNSFVSIEREVELMKAYLSIEKMRYQERLEIIYDLDETLDFELPALTLQPLVENAVQHGILDRDKKIVVEIAIKRAEENGVVIQIKDNGMGISKVKQEELLAEKNHRIGFSNVLKKIRLMKNSDLTLESEEGKGTCITINLRNIPLQ
ncbi:ATP-binding protein [Anaerocolumna xylanovorans]|uniref:Stage 0 sporulation protein A homolog n=1 Tax=Anaerocolumna xylanovorans DSM 12503 TaxID=1121345 RepID=A0A1M7Y779_9FIRM|nr:ATP-binding protein [Anaerocolumna xylanovorans]SHO48492.1 Histidine kinase-, DNA gyrase B-, and HSP90-like ATPase [Anaerocolumna xylanovorans DSM 12503]